MPPGRTGNVSGTYYGLDAPPPPIEEEEYYAAPIPPPPTAVASEQYYAPAPSNTEQSYATEPPGGNETIYATDKSSGIPSYRLFDPNSYAPPLAPGYASEPVGQNDSLYYTDETTKPMWRGHMDEGTRPIFTTRSDDFEWDGRANTQGRTPHRIAPYRTAAPGSTMPGAYPGDQNYNPPAYTGEYFPPRDRDATWNRWIGGASPPSLEFPMGAESWRDPAPNATYIGPGGSTVPDAALRTYPSQYQAALQRAHSGEGFIDKLEQMERARQERQAEIQQEPSTYAPPLEGLFGSQSRQPQWWDPLIPSIAPGYGR